MTRTPACTCSSVTSRWKPTLRTCSSCPPGLSPDRRRPSAEEVPLLVPSTRISEPLESPATLARPCEREQARRAASGFGLQRERVRPVLRARRQDVPRKSFRKGNTPPGGSAPYARRLRRRLPWQVRCPVRPHPATPQPPLAWTQSARWPPNPWRARSGCLALGAPARA